VVSPAPRIVLAGGGTGAGRGQGTLYTLWCAAYVAASVRFTQPVFWRMDRTWLARRVLADVQLLADLAGSSSRWPPAPAPPTPEPTACPAGQHGVWPEHPLRARQARGARSGATDHALHAQGRSDLPSLLGRLGRQLRPAPVGQEPGAVVERVGLPHRRLAARASSSASRKWSSASWSRPSRAARFPRRRSPGSKADRHPHHEVPPAELGQVLVE